MCPLIVGKLYIYKKYGELVFHNKWPPMKWHEPDQAWVYKPARNEAIVPEINWKVLENNTPCMYIGSTNNINVGAFLVGENILGISRIRVL